MTSFDWRAMWAPQWSLAEIALRATLVYLFTLATLRALGRKQLARYATHDIVLLFLISTAVRQAIVGPDTSLTGAFVGLGTLCAWDRLLSLLTFRSRRLARVIDGPVRQLVRDGVLDHEQLRRAGISRDELTALLRSHGHQSMSVVNQAFLERSGRVTFILATH